MPPKKARNVNTESSATPKTKELSFGSKVGRALQKLTELNEGERAELANSPESIRARYAAKRDALLVELEPAVRTAALGAMTATVTEAKAAE